ncbi:DUF3298 and DUF4163 domain-containing protein [Kaistella palustris]|uniref:DUF3298 and DUF4163 domain-containing protein n=1 Tax=Kaistella palustris TaxID=493376 RepID=UPI0004885AA3|nr:DUF3298 and DUF4163 domain-containing protein [Kaistella palustris]
MKNLVLVSAALFACTISCKKSTVLSTEPPAAQKDSLRRIPQFVVDSVKINDSLALNPNLTASFEKSLLVFPTVKNKALLDSIYARENIHAENFTKADLLAAAENQKEKFYTDTRKSLAQYTPVSKQIWSNSSRMKVFSNDRNILTIKYSGDGFTGGAHGYYYEFYKVFDLQKNKTIHLSDIIKVQNQKIWGRILMDNFLNNDLEKGQSKMLLVKEIPLTENFYFDAENLYFLYNQYEITAYAAGTVLIKVPLTDIKPFLTADFKKKLDLN